MALEADRLPGHLLHGRCGPRLRRSPQLQRPLGAGLQPFPIYRRHAPGGRHLGGGSRDTAAIQIKLDELLRAVENADDLLVGIEERSAEELELIRKDKAPTPRSN
ncbi:low affinity iron permease family protein [Methylobacterium pseudosasicola]|uniref:low affinity iron permease family protein n=1 Tax=Methylobacterium pseudosasicola TaxID=582667 RepID=UPI000B85C960